MELLFSTCIHPLQYTLTHTFILCLCIIPSNRFTHCTGLPASSRAAARASQVIAACYQITISKENTISSRFQLAWTTCFYDKAFTSNILQLFINACKLQLRDNTYTMIHSFSQNQFSSYLQISRKAQQSLTDLEWLPGD